MKVAFVLQTSFAWKTMFAGWKLKLYARVGAL
jgi:hypothetical protein